MFNIFEIKISFNMSLYRKNIKLMRKIAFGTLFMASVQITALK